MREENLKENHASVLAGKLLALLGLAQDLVADGSLPVAVRTRVESVAAGLTPSFWEPLSLKDGSCPRCGSTTFKVEARIDSWGTCLEESLARGTVYCEGCGQNIKMSESAI